MEEEHPPQKKTLPLAKKQKIDDNEYRLVDLNVDTISLNLTKHCLCQLPETCMLKEVFRVSNVSSWSRERLLNFLSSARLTCDIALKQLSEGTICTSVERLSNYLIANKTGIVNEIVSLLMRADPYISYAASNALAEIFVCSQNKLDNVWVEELTDLFLRRSPETLCPVISVYKRVLCWRDAQMIDSEKNIKMPENCISRKVIFEDEEIEMDDEFGIGLVKTKVIEVLQTQWQMIVLKFVRYMSSFDHCIDISNEPFNHKMGHLAIIEFIKLWTSMVSIKTNLNVMNIKYFYADLGQMLILLRRPKVQPVVWKNIINLFNESLCYTTTLAVQGTMQEEPCMLARELVKVVKTKNMLNNMPFRKGTGEYGGGEEEEGDKKLLQDTVLLILKAVATIIKETKNDSSSSDSSSEEEDEHEDSEEVDAEMAIIESSVNEVLRKLDGCVKKCMSYLPETPIAQWIVQLFSNRNDVLIESMICTIDISLVLCYRRNSLPMLRHVLNPTASLVEFLQTISYNNDANELILDLLLGSDTSFLLYIMRILKFICNRWSEFCLCCDTRLQSTMAAFKSLQTSLEQLIKNDLTPYNLNPVLRLLVKCNELFACADVRNT